MDKKPITVAKYEFDKKMETLINETLNEGILPGFVIMETVANALDMLRRLSNTQLKNDLEAYASMQNEEKKG